MKKVVRTLGWLIALTALWLDVAIAAEWIVQPGASISAAVQAAAAGDTVKVERGYYVDHVVIDKPLRLQGVNRPTISGENQGDVIRVKSPDVVIEGFIIRDSGDDLTAQNAGVYVEPGAHRAIIRNNDFAYTLFGLWLEKANGLEVTNNLITGKRDFASAQRGNGIQLYNCYDAKIIGNNISFVRDGIYVDVSFRVLFRGNKMHHARYGTHYMNSHDNIWEDNESYKNRGGLALMEVRRQIVRNNRTWDNSDHGIMLRTIQDSVVENNIIVGNSKGFFIYDAEYNVLKGNLVMGNRIGVHLWAGSINNDVDHNDFIQNHNQIRYVATRNELWGKGKGNYWSNYVGWDADGDGIGDTPYEANDVVDRLNWKYPLVKLLLNSPAVQSLRLIARQFPLLRGPSVRDNNPRMLPFRSNWSDWLGIQRH
ncbi:MAG TPA: nitrous oxide reductase family maturation protein NosD [Candidatus Competibacteraceae bacterium]|nr:nitrous oxide reductase family maturation protein NosD [Candidatus Competibacteraceae bacterium]